MAENVTKLSVQMLGGFHMYWGNREVRIKSGSSTKAAHILQLVLFNAPERVPTDTLTREVFAGCDLLDPNNNLKASLTLLRKQLLASGLPRSSYITFRDRGYIWTEQLPPELDTQLFEAAALFALFGLLMAVWRRQTPATRHKAPATSHQAPGAILGLYLIGYAVIRFFIEILRGDPRAAVGPFSISQAISIGMIVVGSLFIFNAKRKRVWRLLSTIALVVGI